jgi:hypothetical protein
MCNMEGKDLELYSHYETFCSIPWNSSNNASTLVIKFEFIIFYSDSRMYTFCIVGFVFGKTIVFCLVTNTGSTPLDILMH